MKIATAKKKLKKQIEEYALARCWGDEVQFNWNLTLDAIAAFEKAVQEETWRDKMPPLFNDIE